MTWLAGKLHRLADSLWRLAQKAEVAACEVEHTANLIDRPKETPR